MTSAPTALDVDGSWSGPLMSRDPAPPPADAEAAADEGGPAAILKGSARGLEVVIDARASAAAIAAAVTARLEAAPGFFRGNDVRIRVEDGPLATGCLALLDEIASRFELRIVEVGAARRPETVPPVVAEPVPAPAPEPASEAELTPVPEADVASAAEPEPEPVSAADPDPDPALELPPAFTRVVVGPVRSGVILEHTSHIVIFGDINPGAEVRAAGSIVVLGRLRGTAHAGIGRDGGFILALRLEPQQLRIGRLVARAADSDQAASHPEIAHVAGDSIIVEAYRGRLPSALAAGLQEELHG